MSSTRENENPSRRAFLHTTALAGLAAVSGPARLPSVPQTEKDTRLPGWCDRPMRWAQLTLTEDDPGTFDVQFWLDYFKRTHSDAACLSAGGCVAYYPTKIPLHRRSRWLGDRDPFGDLVAGCRRLGMNVIARTDSHAAHDGVEVAHPDWIAVDAEGRKRRHWASPELWVTCGLGPYNFEFMTGVIREIVTLYRVDGIFINRWDGSGMCHCGHCRRLFKEACGLALPRSSNPQDPARNDYLLWRQQRLFELWELWGNTVREINPDACVIPNTGGGALSALDMRPWFTKFSGTIRDPRWLPVVENIYTWHHRAEKYLRNVRPLARVGLVYSQQTSWFYGGDQARAKVEDPILGFYQALIESRVPFEMVHDRLLDPGHLDPFGLLILPNTAALSDAQCRQLDEYVGRGGSLIATYETSLYDERGNPRDDFGLTEAFGVSFQRKAEGPMRNAYLRLEKDPATGGVHPLLAGLEDAPRIVHGTRRLEVKPTRPFPNQPLTLIPPYPDLPMEAVYPRVPETDIPEVYLSDRGKSRVIYFPWDIDRVFWEVMAVDHGTLLRNAVLWALNGEQPVAVTGPGVLDVTAWRQNTSMTVHLVNLTNPMMMKGPVRDFVPLSEQRVRLHLPEGKRATGVRLLVAGIVPEWTASGSRVDVRVPSIVDHEVVAVDF